MTYILDVMIVVFFWSKLRSIIKMKKIVILDEIHARANPEAREVIKFALAYKKEYWRKGYFAKQQIIKTQYLITGRKGSSGTFLTGLIKRVLKYCKNREIKIEVIDKKRERIKPDSKPELKNITFRKDQLSALKKIKRINRGKIIAPTGSGKTIIALGIISMFRTKRCAIIAHTKDLIGQITNEAQSFKESLPVIFNPRGSKEVENTLKSIRTKQSPCLLITTIQSISKVDNKNFIDLFDVIIIDECHHVTKLNSQYGRFLEFNLAPRRYGFTGTDSFKSKESLLVNEGLLGPVISKLTIKKGIKDGTIAKPEIKLINVEYDNKITKASRSKYSNFYQFGIVENKTRNELIKKIVEKALKNKSPTLIIIEKIKHGELLQTIFKKRLKINVPFIQGSLDNEERMRHKNDIIKNKNHIVIASKVWMEGINIKNLEIIIYAAGMKEKKRVLQAMGRGLRTTETKKSILLIDFLDPYKYLAEHSITRLQTYNEEKWI